MDYKHKFLLIVPLVLSASIYSTGQNLIKNGSFEEKYFCPSNYTEDNAKTFLPTWGMPNKGTPDYFNKCSKDMVGVPLNYMGNIHPFEGVAYVGLVLLDTPKNIDKEINYREYIQAPLNVSLQRNELYLIKFYYSVAGHSTFCTNRLGVYLSQSKISNRKGVLDYKPQLYIDTSAVYFNPGEWVQFSDTFRAYGGENFITIGNFYKDSKTRYMLNDISMYPPTMQEKITTNQVAYYYIDNVSVEKINKNDYRSEYGFIQKLRPLSHYHEEVLKKPAGVEIAYLLDEVYFNIQLNNSTPISFYQTDTLANFLAKTPGINLLVTGLWFNAEKDSAEASSRAKSIYSLLVAKGVEKNRISVNTEKIKPLLKSVKFYISGNPAELFANLVAVRVIKNSN